MEECSNLTLKLMRRLANTFALSLLTAVVTTISGHLINQLPPVPNKEKNAPWIMATVIGATLTVGILTFLQQSSGQSETGSSEASANKIKGNGNEIQARGPGANVNRNQVEGNDNSITAGSGEPPDNS
jgi:hypothetical protein